MSHNTKDTLIWGCVYAVGLGLMVFVTVFNGGL